ncbi:hypothetical protein NIES37_44920 [Tolypothrix tenuis PCC 7101]|uniref:Uncharacterized protein n=1 Tax=Tolypothrix tenuis PCC 7101 TaxID=231146 RepID=A0A1Z4N434_9CYAN|nr:hypothetical protein [Aulosira sp. FACHB-113]BAZ00500.1 hypothetical protein NIES37_44920 [Tolypothrix tenuis PCC 7101]BAZ75578.1 hypothetical protein NIES50_41660 [Aulosira laxa NIES-50]
MRVLYHPETTLLAQLMSVIVFGIVFVAYGVKPPMPGETYSNLHLVSKAWRMAIEERWLLSSILVGVAVVIPDLAYLWLIDERLERIEQNIDEYRAMLSLREEEEEIEAAQAAQAQEEQAMQDQLSPEQYQRPKKTYE